MLTNEQIERALMEAFALGKATQYYAMKSDYMNERGNIQELNRLIMESVAISDEAREDLKNAVHNLPTYVEDWQEVPRLHYKVGHRDCRYQVIDLLNGEAK